MKLLDRLLDLLYPPRCLICHEFLEPGAGAVCAECIDTLPEFDGADPHVRFAERCAATFFYEEKLRDSFLRYKFSGRDWYAKQYGKWMAVTIRDKLTGKYDIMTWVPVSRQRKKERGYDQAELLCRSAARELGMEPVRTLEKLTDNRAQSTLNDASERMANAAGVYGPYQAERFAGKRVLLIDDIVTTAQR